MFLEKHNKIDVSEGIDVNKTSGSKESITYHYWYLLNNGFVFQSSVMRNDCHDVLMRSTDINTIAMLSIHGVYCCCIIIGVTRCETINLFSNNDSRKKMDHYKM